MPARLADALAERAREHAGTLCVGRTHGVHAEPTSFGLKLAGFAFEAYRNAERLERAFAEASVGAISGAVGTYATLGPDYERRVLATLGLEAEPVSTQVVPRDRHAALLQAVALAGAGLERFATEIRHLQRTEVREVEEPFRAGQKGSSAMPHKRNPIVTERITGLARVLRGYAQAGVEDVALWHERDISHSGAERVILPDATIALDYMQALALRVVEGMVVHRDRMRREPRAHLRRALLPARAARAGRRAAWAATTRTGSCSAWRSRRGTRRRRCARCSTPSRASSSTSTRSSTTGTTSGTCPRYSGGFLLTDAVLIHGAPAALPDLFHVIPSAIGDPFLYLEADGRRAATVERARRRPGGGARHRGPRPVHARAWTSSSPPARRSCSARPASRRRLPRARDRGGARPRRVPARHRRPAARARASR